VSEINDGGPAFPLQVIASPNSEIQHGMSLRDWFAGQVLSGIMANTDWSENCHESIASAAYDNADAMLAAREAKL